MCWNYYIFFPLCLHLKTAIAVIHGIVNFTQVVQPWHSTARMNTMFEESVQLSVTTPMWILAFRITDYSFWKYVQHKNLILVIKHKTVQIILCSQIVNVNNVSIAWLHVMSFRYVSLFFFCMGPVAVFFVCFLFFSCRLATPKTSGSLPLELKTLQAYQC